MINYSYILTLPKPDIAGILTACGYAIREDLSLFDALEELGFSGIDTEQIKDLSYDENLITLSYFCLTQLSKQVQDNDQR